MRHYISVYKHILSLKHILCLMQLDVSCDHHVTHLPALLGAQLHELIHSARTSWQDSLHFNHSVTLRAPAKLTPSHSDPIFGVHLAPLQGGG